MSEKNKTVTFSGAVKSLKNNLSPKHKRRFWLISFLLMISALFDVVGLGLIIPLINLAFNPTYFHNYPVMMDMYNFFGFSSDNNFVIFLVVIILGFYIFKSIVGLLVNWFSTLYMIDVAVYITRNQYEKYYRLSYLDFSNIPSAAIINNVFNNTGSYMLWVITPLLLLMSEVFIILFIITSIIVYDFQLFFCITATIGPATWLIYNALKNKSTRFGKAINEVIPKVYTSLNNSIFGYMDIKLAGKEEEFKKNYMGHIRKFHQLTLKNGFLVMVPLRGYEIVALLGIVVIFVYLKFIAGSDSGSEALVLFAAAAYRLMPSMNRIVNSMMYIKQSVTTVEFLEAYNDKLPPKNESAQQEEIKFEKQIEFKDVCFRFPGSDKNVLNNLGLIVKKGEKVGFVGASGSGKTTLMNVLLRFFNEENGNILVDGVKLTDNNIRSWRKMIGYVKQDIFIIDGSIKENIAFGETEINEPLLRSAVKQASLEDLVESLPLKYENHVGEKGNKLSGGQRQRLGIARALYRDAQILVFDEATSALDTDTETEVTEAIDRLSDVHKTIFIIAHRVTTLKNCDRIYEIKDGEISGVFSYEELIDRVI